MSCMGWNRVTCHGTSSLKPSRIHVAMPSSCSSSSFMVGITLVTTSTCMPHLWNARSATSRMPRHLETRASSR